MCIYSFHININKINNGGGIRCKNNIYMFLILEINIEGCPQEIY